MACDFFHLAQKKIRLELAIENHHKNSHLIFQLRIPHPNNKPAIRNTSETQTRMSLTEKLAIGRNYDAHCRRMFRKLKGVPAKSRHKPDPWTDEHEKGYQSGEWLRETEALMRLAKEGVAKTGPKDRLQALATAADRFLGVHRAACPFYAATRAACTSRDEMHAIAAPSTDRRIEEDGVHRRMLEHAYTTFVELTNRPIEQLLLARQRGKCKAGHPVYAAMDCLFLLWMCLYKGRYEHASCRFISRERYTALDAALRKQHNFVILDDATTEVVSGGGTLQVDVNVHKRALHGSEGVQPVPDRLVEALRIWAPIAAAFARVQVETCEAGGLSRHNEPYMFFVVQSPEKTGLSLVEANGSVQRARTLLGERIDRHTKQRMKEWGLEARAFSARCNRVRGCRMTAAKEAWMKEHRGMVATDEMLEWACHKQLAAENHTGEGAVSTAYCVGTARPKPKRHRGA